MANKSDIQYAEDLKGVEKSLKEFQEKKCKLTKLINEKAERGDTKDLAKMRKVKMDLIIDIQMLQMVLDMAKDGNKT